MSSDLLATYADRRGSAQWFVNRLRCMTPAEVLHRAATAIARPLDLARRSTVAAGAIQVAATRVPWIAAAREDLTLDPAAYEEAADRVVAGEVTLLDGASWQVGNPPRWFAGPSVPLFDAPAPQAHRTTDERLLIELHRHQPLITLAQAFRATGAERYRHACAAWLAHWVRFGSHAGGPAWNSALEAAVRLVHWSIAWQLLGAQAGAASDDGEQDALRARWLDEVLVHVRFVRRNLSSHSSANNHLIGELTGLYVASLTWPVLQEVPAWGAEARAALVNEALRQNASDGVNREASTRYQVFVFELLALAVGAGAAVGDRFPAAVYERLAAMARFIAAMRDAGGNVPLIGDADGATIAQLDPRPADPFDAAIAWAVALGAAPELAPLVRGRHERIAWLLGRHAFRQLSMPTRPRGQPALQRRFDEGGYFILGSRIGERDEVLMQIDCGPLGYLGIAAHGHADALSLCLSIGGAPVLVDRGTFVYNAEPRWRRFLRGTLAHNTVCVDGLDQSIAGGPFLWVSKARAKLLRFTSAESGGGFTGSHDGYLRLRDPVLHTRHVDWSAPLARFCIADVLECHAPHDIAIAWHFAPTCRVEVADGVARVTAPRARATFRVESRAPVDDGGTRGRWSLHHGGNDAFLGWHSCRFGERVPAPSLLWRARIEGAATFLTTIDLSHEAD